MSVYPPSRWRDLFARFLLRFWLPLGFIVAVLCFAAGLCAEESPRATFASVQHGRWMDVVATAYCPCPICCGVRAAGITSEGVRVAEQPYGIAAHPRYLEPGTLVFIPTGQGYLDHAQADGRVFRVDDTGGTVRRLTEETRDLWIDLRYRTHAAAREWGVRRIRIFVFDTPNKDTP